MKENNEDKYNILKLQNKILQIIVYIDKLCQENNIEYYLMGGSALGAVRHGGFIPWDDDLDIFMKPNDYAKFRNIFLEKGDHENYYLQQLFLRDGMVASAKMRLNKSTYIEKATMKKKIHHGIFVDIFILHNCPNVKFLQLLQCLAAKYILIKGQGLKDIEYHGIKKIVISLFKILPKEMGIKSALKYLYSYDNKKSNYVCHFMGKAFFTKGIYEAKYFIIPVRVPFEKVELNIPCNTDEYLRSRFGDYMKIPSDDSIKYAQHAYKWDVENDFSIFVNQDHDYSDEKYLV